MTLSIMRIVHNAMDVSSDQGTIAPVPLPSLEFEKKLTRTYVYPPGDGGNLEPRQHVGECRWSISDLYWPIIHQLAYVGYVGEV